MNNKPTKVYQISKNGQLLMFVYVFDEGNSNRYFIRRLKKLNEINPIPGIVAMKGFNDDIVLQLIKENCNISDPVEIFDITDELNEIEETLIVSHKICKNNI